MNRIQQMAEGSARPPAVYADLGHSLLSSGRDEALEYTLFAPLHYEQNYAYPLIVWLHGAGDDERQLRRIMPQVSMRNYVAVAPRGPSSLSAPQSGFSWEHTDRAIVQAEHVVFESIEVARDRLNVNTQRVFLAGYADGGTMALRIGLKYPRRFAGLLSLGGPFPTGSNPLAYLPEARSVPLFIAQGRAAQQYSVDQMCADLRLLHAAGMNLTLRQYPGGDELTLQILHDMNVWIMERVTSG